MKMMDDLPVISRTIDVQRLPATGKHVVIEPSDEERAAMCAFCDLVEIRTLEAKFLLERLRGEKLRLTGLVKADVVQRCVVSLDPVDAKVHEIVDLELVPSEAIERYLEKADEDGALVVNLERDVPDTYEGGVVDVGAFLLEHLALGLEPYPHKQGISLDDVYDAVKPDPESSPFAKLSSLKDTLKS